MTRAAMPKACVLPDCPIKHFQEKWEPVFRPKMRQTKNLAAASVSPCRDTVENRTQPLRQAGIAEFAANAPMTGRADAGAQCRIGQVREDARRECVEIVWRDDVVRLRDEARCPGFGDCRMS